jgi:predicted P-loop ATPase
VQRAAVSKERYEKDKAAVATGWKECDIVVELTEEGARAKVLQLNVINAFKKHDDWINRLGYNTFDGRVTVDRRDMTVTDLAEANAWLCDFLKWSMEYRPREAFEESITEAARGRPWNPIAEELRGFVWDGRDRMKKFTEAVVQDPEPLDFEIMKKWVIGFVARGLEPGCQMDTVLCLREAEGGGFKTTFARVMAGAPERFSGSPGFGSDKDSAMLRVGMRIVELGEGLAARKADRYAMKEDITRRDDHFRAPWGRMAERRLRGFVYILTSNDFSFLRSDQDGLRRVWPVNARDIIDIEWVRENRDQLLAQAVTLHGKGVPWWWNRGEEPPALLERQGSAVAEDFLDEAVVEMIHNQENVDRGYVLLSDAKRQVEALSGIILNSTHAQHLFAIMTKHKMIARLRRFAGGKRQRVWGHPSWKIEQDGRVIDLKFRTESENRIHPIGVGTPETGEGVPPNSSTNPLD